jgi:Ca2+-transporting ATPase
VEPAREKGWELMREYPLSPKFLAVTRVWHSPGDSDFVVATKGVPEAVLSLCNLSDSERQQVIDRATVMAGDGLRVLGVAKASFARHDLPEDPLHFNFEFLGLVGLTDPRTGPKFVRAGK